jgi:hypothetical protein
MSRENTAAILSELRRVGVEVDALPAPLVGTSLRASEVLAWRREIPSDAGVDELIRRLDERRARAVEDHIVNAHWMIEGPHPRLRPPRKRDWPTQPLLDAGTALMIEEWDPFGIRLGARERETVAMFVFHFFGPLLAPNGLIDAITHTTGMIASAERDRLGLTPSPEPHRRYLAVRLRELVDQYPVPPVNEWPPSAVVVVGYDGSGPPPLDPEGVCARCQSFGTVARTTLQTKPPTFTRYCGPCWREVRAEHMAFHQRPPRIAAEHVVYHNRMRRLPMSWESRTWDDVLEMLEMVDASRPLDENEAAQLAELAAELWRFEARMADPMSPEVEAFVHNHAPPPA